MAKDDVIFGLQINSQEKKEERTGNTSFAPPGSDDGAIQIPVNAGGLDALTHSYILSTDAGVASEAELIERYRTVAVYPECDMAIEEICNEAIVYDDHQPIVSIDFDQLDDEELGDPIRERIREELQYILGLMNFNTRAYEIFRRWYIDSRLAYHKIVNPDNTKEGITELRFLDPRKVKRVKEIERSKDSTGRVDLSTVVDEYFIYIEKATTYNKTFSGHLFGDAIYNSGQAPGTGQGAIKISLDAVAFVHSGLVDPSSGVIYGYLQKSIKPFNQLRMLEDALVIYRLSRAPERRIFYVDVGNMSPAKSEYYVKQLQNRYRNKVSYDANTGEIADKRRTMAMQEDFWLPRREGSRGTQIDTLPGGQNLGEIEDILYFKDKLWNSLNVPPSRFKTEGMQALLGPNAEISREELKFAKFINRIRAQFSFIIHDILGTQLILKQVLTEDEWNEIEERIKYSYAKDSYFAEARDAEVTRERVSLLGDVDPYVGKYFSMRWVQRNVLRMSDEDIDDMKKEIEGEIKSGTIPDPAKAEEEGGFGGR